jgi:hypothetical protein
MDQLNARIAHIPLPRRFVGRPLSPTGFPVPWFVSIRDGVPDFVNIHPQKVVEAINRKVCWLCGERLGRYLAFTIGPMCAVNRVSAEPPTHYDCARYAVLRARSSPTRAPGAMTRTSHPAQATASAS